MHMIFADSTLNYLHIVRIAGLTDKLSGSVANLFDQHFIPILRYPNQMNFKIVNCV